MKNRFKIILSYLVVASVSLVLLYNFVDDNLNSTSYGNDIWASLLMPIFIVFSTFGLYFVTFLLFAYIGFRVAKHKKNEEAIFAFRFLSRLFLIFFIAYAMYWMFT